MSLFDDLLAPAKPAQTESTTQSSGTSTGSGQLSGTQDDSSTTGNPIIITETTQITGADSIIVTPESIPTTPIINTIEEDSLPIILSTENVIPEVTTTPVEANMPVILEDTPATSEVIDTHGILDITSEAIETQTSSLIDTASISMIDTVIPVAEVAEESETTFHDTQEYITHALDEVGSLITTIDAADKIKLAEEEEYKKQKEHYAELELQAETEHKKMLEERSHAEKMKTYLENEQGEKTKTEEPTAIA